MLKRINPEQYLTKKDYKAEIGDLEKQMAALQEEIKNLQIPVMIVFEGWSASGKGTTIARVVYPLDPRHFSVNTMNRFTEESVMRPFLWTYWIRTPSRGRITIYDKSWHRMILPEFADKIKMSDAEKKSFRQDVIAFERQLTDDGTLIIKLFLHIGREEQQRRFKELEKNPDTKWRVVEDDWEQNKRYDYFLSAFSDMLTKTNTPENPWHIVETADRRYAITKIYKIIISQMEKAVEAKRRAEAPETPEAAPVAVIPSILKSVDLSKTIKSNEDYKKRLEELQKKISDFGYKLYSKRKSVVIVYEGWDAAGKGGNIKRVTEELDPRGYEVIPICAPTSEELHHHYLWRFYTQLPKDGHIAIFDRSWYGRVLVERVEDLTPVSVWQRAYSEIVEMERHIASHGTIIFKFWLHIDESEQLARFKSRQEDPLKQYKITAEDWRNREKWGSYEIAAEEMLQKTGSDFAPWTIIESNCKKYARIRTLEIITDELEKRLQ